MVVMKRTVKLPIGIVPSLLFLLCSNPLIAQGDLDARLLPEQPANTVGNKSVGESHISGFFSPAGPPSAPPKRIDAGPYCIVDLNQAYRVTGTLSGTFNVNYRIKVDGPCGSPSGTYDEDWIAHGTFSGKWSGEDTAAKFTYVAHVSAGGMVEGKMTFRQGVQGELMVRGDFADGKLSYQSVVPERHGVNMEYSEIARRWFRGVYESDPTVVSELAAKDIVISYPIFQKLFGKPALRGKEAAKGFASGFSQRWTETEVTFHETVVKDSQVFLVWSFKGRNVGCVRDDTEPTREIHEWGGITLIRFNDEGKIVAEIGEESEPGPMGRLNTAAN
jgi:hypothetical protein